MRRLRWWCILLFGWQVAIAADAGTDLVPAKPESGFNFPYLLRPAADPSSAVRVLLVETNNTGAPSDDPEVHLRAARELAEKGFGSGIAAALNVPMLVPVFPRPKAQSLTYTHALDRDTLEITSGPLRRLDLQLVAMIDDARRRLTARRLGVPPRVLLTGFSASGTFANRFVALHPERVLAAATGGTNALVILPVTNHAGVDLPYPLGVSDLRKLTGEKFDLTEWRGVPQFLFMGADDTNDAVEFDDAFSAGERERVYQVVGRAMLPTRWAQCEAIYSAARANAAFKIYAGIGHGTNGAVKREVVEFFRAAIGEKESRRRK
jgi:hypothetical protein